MVKISLRTYIMNIGLLVFINIPISVYAELFESQPLIQLPGDNTQMTVTLSWGEPTFMAWINLNNGTYSLCVQQIYPGLDTLMIIQSTSNQLYKPSIQKNPWGEGTKLVWSEKKSGFWKLNYQNYQGDEWTPGTTIIEGLQDTVKASAGIYRVCWTSGGMLYVKELFSAPGDTTYHAPLLIDSTGCNNPDIIRPDYSQYTNIVYEKVIEDSTYVKMAGWSQYTGEWSYDILSVGSINRYPRYGPEFGLCYQTLQDSLWKIAYPLNGDIYNFTKTTNESVNYQHPMQYVFPIPILQYRETLYDYLLVFDSDSLENNLEIMGILYQPFTSITEMINISNLPGNDTWPYLVKLFDGDSIEVGVIWQHETINGIEIWWARAPFELIYGNTDNTESFLQGFHLDQNYPNPFNPISTIQYQLPQRSDVQITIYDLLGREVTTLVSETQEAGFKSVQWNATNDKGQPVSTGVYFYQIKADGFVETRKMVLLR